MALNRTEIKGKVDIEIVAELEIADHRAFLKDDLADQIEIRKDVVSTGNTPAAGTVVSDFTSKDTDLITITDDVTVSFTGLVNGDSNRTLVITKPVGKSVSFTGATDVSTLKDYITTNLTTVVYNIKQKNGVVYVDCVSVDKNLVGGGLLMKVIPIGVWNMQSTQIVYIAHGLGAVGKIRAAQAVIYNDAGTERQMIDLFGLTTTSPAGKVQGWDFTGQTIELFRRGSDIFDQASYSSVVINRGHITFWHVP